MKVAVDTHVIVLALIDTFQDIVIDLLVSTKICFYAYGYIHLAVY